VQYNVATIQAFVPYREQRDGVDGKSLNDDGELMVKTAAAVCKDNFHKQSGASLADDDAAADQKK
jgi:hypothetical protein